MQDFALEPLLAQVGQDFQRCGEGIALAGSEEVIPVDALGEHLRQEGLEDSLRPAGADIDEVQGMRAEVGEIGALEFKIALREHALEEFIRQTADGRLVVQTGSDGINSNHNEKRES